MSIHTREACGALTSNAVCRVLGETLTLNAVSFNVHLPTAAAGSAQDLSEYRECVCMYVSARECVCERE